MTNKLPEVGGIYKDKSNKKYRVASIDVKLISNDSVAIFRLVEFDNYFEEIADHSVETNDKVEDNRFTDVGKTIEEAKEELRKQIIDTEEDIKMLFDKDIIKVGDWYPGGLIIKAENLLDALDAQKNNNLPSLKDLQTRVEKLERLVKC